MNKSEEDSPTSEKNWVDGEFGKKELGAPIEETKIAAKTPKQGNKKPK
jgi:hypothetical protein